MEDYKSTVLSQYANSPTIMALIDFINQWIDPQQNLDDFYKLVFDVQTAQGVGLDVWGKIVDVSRSLEVPAPETYLGFDEAATTQVLESSPQPFGQAPMYSGPAATTTYRLTDEPYRKLIMVKALANITNCTAPSLNDLIGLLFDAKGRAYVADLGQMRMRYVFEFLLSPVELSILTKSTAVPRPAGVMVTILQIDVANTFGFANTGLQPFGQGAFFTSTGLQDAI